MTDMTEDERIYRAHLALHGQPLLIEWMTRCVQTKCAARALLTGAVTSDSFVVTRYGIRAAWDEAVRREYGQSGAFSKIDGHYRVCCDKYHYIDIFWMDAP